MANSADERATGTTGEDVEAFAAELTDRAPLIGIDAGTKTLGSPIVGLANCSWS